MTSCFILGSLINIISKKIIKKYVALKSKFNSFGFENSTTNIFIKSRTASFLELYFCKHINKSL